MNFSEKLQQTLGKSIKDAANEEIYAALLSTVKEAAADKGRNISEIGRKVYYISAEFLIGKLLSNNLINLGVYDEVRELLAANGKDICEIEEVEPEPSLGNGGLGRLATEDWAAWPPASWIPLQHLVWKETESGLTIILDCSNRYLKITNRKRLQTHGSRIQAGLLIQESDSMYRSKISACILNYMILM